MEAIKINRRWEAVGPFPSGMREHPLLGSPMNAFPSDRGYSDPDVDFATRPFGEGSWPSELPAGGQAGWAAFEGDEEGGVEVSYPEVDWDQLRADHGWSSLQYQIVLRTSVTIPSTGRAKTPILIDALQVVEYAFVSKLDPNSPVTWYAGDVYGFADSPSGKPRSSYGKGPSNFARGLALEPGDYSLILRTIYECRMFGDPGQGKPPVIKVKLGIWADSAAGEGVVVAGGRGAVPDVVDGLFMGSWATIPLRSAASATEGETWFVEVASADDGQGVHLEAVETTRLVAGQTRNVPLRIRQTALFTAESVGVKYRYWAHSGGVASASGWVEYAIPVSHKTLSASSNFLITFASPAAKTVPAQISSAIVVVPVDGPTSTRKHLPPVILALHGAGVDIQDDFWTSAMPRIPGIWSVLPSGHTEWGEDWHGGSLLDVWAARDALGPALARLKISVSSETLLVGHSNGGQGAWHAAARYPDRIVGLIAVAGYVKIQDYVPYSEQQSIHFADPALLGILHASLTPYNNDLYASNLVHIPILAVHGGKDDNVPPRHGRANAGFVSSWVGAGCPPGVNANANIKYVEVPGKPHWWDGVLQLPEITEFITSLPPKLSPTEERARGFTLSTANPDETGSKAGVRIARLVVPGRLARLEVNQVPGGGLILRGSNVATVECSDKRGVVTLKPHSIRGWSPAHSKDKEEDKGRRAYGPMIRLLASEGPLLLVVPGGTGDGSLPSCASVHLTNLARAYAHDIYTYHRLDAEVIPADAALRRVSEGLVSGNIVVFGRPDENRFTAWLVEQRRIPVKFEARNRLSVGGHQVAEPAGIITLHPHPSNPNSLAAIVAGITTGPDPDTATTNPNTTSALTTSLAARLLPVRTGVLVPDWAVVTPQSRWQGAGGMVGAGFWAQDWAWSEGMSWFANWV